jgi:hypothetical protein
VKNSATPEVELKRFAGVRPWELGVRFAFGFVISIAAALIGMRFGHHIGGLFLAFPAILPASLTLIERKHGDNPASINAMGAVIGGVALVGFALASAWLFQPVHPLIAVALATTAWLAVAVALYFGVAGLRRSRGQRPAPRERPDR